jgi:hypothetical protein
MYRQGCQTCAALIRFDVCSWPHAVPVSKIGVRLRFFFPLSGAEYLDEANIICRRVRSMALCPSRQPGHRGSDMRWRGRCRAICRCPRCYACGRRRGSSPSPPWSASPASSAARLYVLSPVPPITPHSFAPGQEYLAFRRDDPEDGPRRANASRSCRASTRNRGAVSSSCCNRRGCRRTSR